MTLWEEALASVPVLRGAIDDLAGQVNSIRQGGQVEDDFARNAVTGGLRFDMADQSTPLGGVYGYGIAFDVRPRLAVIVQGGLAPLGGAPIGLTRFGQAARLFFGMAQWPQGTVAVGLPPPQIQAGPSLNPGDRVIVGSERATLGLPVLTASGTAGFTTAGHAAPMVPVPVRDERDQVVGRVQSRLWLEGSNGGPTADIAVVEVPGSVGPLQPFAVQAARAGGVAKRGADGSQSTSWVRMLSPEMVFRPDLAPWGEVAITADAISHAGDSGSLVFDQDDAVVGHIVAGYEGIYSVVQDMEFVLSEIGAVLR